MSDYEQYQCPCGRNHPVGVECAIGRKARRKSSKRIAKAKTASEYKTMAMRPNAPHQP